MGGGEGNYILFTREMRLGYKIYLLDSSLPWGPADNSATDSTSSCMNEAGSIYTVYMFLQDSQTDIQVAIICSIEALHGAHYHLKELIYTEIATILESKRYLTFSLARASLLLQ